MFLFIRKYSIIVSIQLLLVLLVLFWLFPTSGLLLWIIFLVLTFTIASSVVLEKYRQVDKEADISQQASIRCVFLETSGLLLAMVLAALLGRHIAELATRHVNNDVTKLVAGIVIGLLVGIGVGILVKRVWGHFVKLI